MKTCTKCKVEKPRSEFHKRKKTNDGLKSQCKVCIKEYQTTTKSHIAAWSKAYYAANRDRIAAYKEANADRIKAYMAEYRGDNRAVLAEKNAGYRKTNVEKERRRHAKYRIENKEKILAYREANRERLAAYASTYHPTYNAAHRELRAIYKMNRRARDYAAEGTFTKADIVGILAGQNGECVYCRCDISKKFYRDHIVALASGGSNRADNIQLLCKPCNSSKGKKTHLEFIMYRISLGRFVAPELIPEDLFI